MPAVVSSASHSGCSDRRLIEERRQEHQSQHGEQILDDQPADRDVACRGVQIVVIGEHAHQDDGAGDGQGHAEHETGGPVPSEAACQQRAEHRGDGALADGAGHGDLAHGQQLLDMELQADAEHQEDHADLGELLGQARIGHESRGVRTDQRTGQQVADDR